MALLVCGYPIVSGVLCLGAIALGVHAWQTYGWQLWHFEKILQSIETLPIPIAIYDDADRLIACNRIYSEHHPKAKGKLDLMDRRVRPRYFDIVSAALDQTMTKDQRAEAAKDWTKRQPPADGKLVERQFPHIGWLRVGKRLLPDGGTVRVAIEINELKEREADLIEAIEHGRRADDMKSQFFSKMTHELRTPLNGIIGLANVVLLQDLDPKTSRNIEVLRNSGVHLLDLVNRVLDFSKLNAHAAPENIIDFDLPELIREVLNEVQFSRHAEGLYLRADYARKLPPFWTGNRTGLRQILTNLVGNGVKFTNQGGVIVTVQYLDASLVIDVVDTGIGIPKDQVEKVFEAFAQADGDWKVQYGGTGLGLTICAEIAEAMQGSIDVDSTPGQGTRFRLSVPMQPVCEDINLPIAS